MFMNVACPTCGHNCRFPERLIGQQVKCPACSNLFQCGTMSLPSLAARPITAERSSSVQPMPPARAVHVQPNQEIHYRCPGCGKSLQSPGHMAGHKVNCPDCGQRLQIPPSSTPAAPIYQRTGTVEESSAPAAPHAASSGAQLAASAAAEKEVILTVLPVASPPAPPRHEYCLECGVDVTQRSHVQTCPDCGSLFCSARCYREHNYHAHPSRR